MSSSQTLRRRIWLVLGLSLLGPALRGAVLTVDLLADELDSACVPGDCSLREALADAGAADTIVFSLPGTPPWTIRLAPGLGPLVLDDPDLTISGPGAASLSISGDVDADGDGDERVMRIPGLGSATIQDLTVRDGLPPAGTGRDGGCLWTERTTDLVRLRFENCRAWSAGPSFCSNQPGGDGGAIYSSGANLEVESSVFVANVAGTGENTSDCQTGMPGGSGGAIAAIGDVIVRRSTFSGNRAGEGGEPNGPGGDGGAIAMLEISPILIEESTFVDNRAGDGRGLTTPHGFDGRGGAIYVENVVVMNNVTIHGNATGSLVNEGRPSRGGGVYSTFGGGELRNVTLTGNSALGEGGGLAHDGGFLRMKHSIVAENESVSSDAEDCHVSSDFDSLGFNLVGVDAGCASELLSSDLFGTVAVPLSPGLEPLAENGGPTPTREVQFSSVALDTGDPVVGCLAWNPFTSSDEPMPTDQRGEPRPVDGGPQPGDECDLGAYERAAPPPDFYLLTVENFGGGPGTVTSDPQGIFCGPICEWFFVPGETVSLTADAGPGATFLGWSGDCSGTSGCSVTMTEDREVGATFSWIFVLDVTVTGAGDVVSEPAGIDCPADCDEEFLDGTVVGLSATPAEGGYFVGWSGSCSGTGACILDMDGPHSVTASFDTLPFLDGFETGDTRRWSSAVP